MTRIKLCGLSEIDHVHCAVELKVDFIGFIFAASRRRIDPPRAAGLIEVAHEYPVHPAAVGVFANERAAEVNSIARGCRLDWVQISGDENWDYCKEIEKPVIKVLHITPDTTRQQLLQTIESGSAVSGKDRLILLLDCKIEGLYGGTGRTFNWNLLENISASVPLIVAGGLNPDNVTRLIKQAHPWGVDVSSGVEMDGRKDINLMRKFVDNVRKMDMADLPGKENQHATRQ